MHHGAGLGLFIAAGIVHGLIALALLVLVVLLIIWAVRQLSGGSGFHLDPAEQDLRRRYAAGEVEREEYLTRLADLRGRSAPPPSPQA
jgi:putative membrane protein